MVSGTVNKCVGLLLATILMSGFGSAVVAAPITVTFDLTTGSTTTTATQTGTGLGNSWTYTDIATGEQLFASAWSDAGGTSLSAAQAVSDGTGLGACNSQEDTTFTIFGFPITLPCTLFGARRPADNQGEQDWLLLVLPDGGLWEEATINVQGGAGGDVSYWVGGIATSDLSGATYSSLSSLGFGSERNFAGTGASFTLDLAGLGGNALLIGADLGDIDDRILLGSVTALIPIPASAWLLGSAFGSLFYMRRRTRQNDAH